MRVFRRSGAWPDISGQRFVVPHYFQSASKKSSFSTTSANTQNCATELQASQPACLVALGGGEVLSDLPAAAGVVRAGIAAAEAMVEPSVDDDEASRREKTATGEAGVFSVACLGH